MFWKLKKYTFFILNGICICDLYLPNNSKIAIDLWGWGRLAPAEFVILVESSAAWGPKIWTRVSWSGGGIGYMPKLISTRDNPRDQRSLATEYWEPWKINEINSLVCDKIFGFCSSFYRIHWIRWKYGFYRILQRFDRILSKNFV